MAANSLLAESVVIYTGEKAGTTGDVPDRWSFASADRLATLVAGYGDQYKQESRRIFTGFLEDQVDGVLHYLEPLPLQPGAPLPDKKKFWQTKIIIVDLATAQRDPEPLASLVESIADRPHVIHLIQLAQDETAPTQTELFRKLRYPALPDPVLFFTQIELETFLDKFMNTYIKAWEGAVQNPFAKSPYVSGNGEPYINPRRKQFIQSQTATGKSIRFMFRDYHSQLPDVVADARDVALVHRLSPNETINLGRAAAIQEFLLIHIINQQDPHARHWVSIDPIRKSILDLPTDTPLSLDRIQETRLLALSLADTGGQPSPEISEALQSVGFIKKVTRVVCFDLQENREQLEPLADWVKVRPFQAELPQWHEPEKGPRFSLTESALGLQIDE